MRQALRNNAHLLNYAIVSTVVIGPVAAFALMRSPSTEEVEAALKKRFRYDIQASQAKSTKIHAFWKTRDTCDMNAVYSGLLKAGGSSSKRHYELTGSLADAEAMQHPQIARLQAPLRPIASEEKNLPPPPTLLVESSTPAILITATAAISVAASPNNSAS